MPPLLFDPLPTFVIPVKGHDSGYPVSRVFCVGRNYAAHAAEMGGEVDREAPWYFTKSAAHAVLSGAEVPFPQGTDNYHHEMELAFAIGKEVSNATETEAEGAVFAFGCALDMTRRDRQQDGKDKRRPWSLGKDVERLIALQKINPNIQENEIAAARENSTGLLDHLSRADLRLDAVRLIRLKE